MPVGEGHCSEGAGTEAADAKAAIRGSRGSADANDELAQIERLHEIIDGTDVKAFDPVGYLVVSGQDDDRNRSRFVMEASQQIQAAAIGQMKIEQDQIMALQVDGFHRGFQVRDPVDLPAFRHDLVASGISDQGIVFNEKYSQRQLQLSLGGPCLALLTGT